MRSYRQRLWVEFPVSTAEKKMNKPQIPSPHLKIADESLGR